jgi:hypothetical protein
MLLGGIYESTQSKNQKTGGVSQRYLWKRTHWFTSNSFSGISNARFQGQPLSWYLL